MDITLMARLRWALLAVALAAPVPAIGQTDSGMANKRVTLNLESADIRLGLKMLFQSVAANYSIDPAVQGSVTVSLTDVPFRVALESLLRSSESQVSLTYRIEDGVYQVGIRIPSDVGGPEPDLPPPPREKKQKVGKIVLNFADVRDVAAILGIPVFESRASQLSGFGNGFGSTFGGNTGQFGGFGQSWGGYAQGNSLFGSGVGQGGGLQGLGGPGGRFNGRGGAGPGR